MKKKEAKTKTKLVECDGCEGQFTSEELSRHFNDDNEGKLYCVDCGSEHEGEETPISDDDE